jgi:uncharacterized protein (DUF433 family)
MNIYSNLESPAMSVNIIDRGRGPEIEGTRITVYNVMDFLKYGDSAESIARDLQIGIHQVQAALDYIAAQRQEVDAEYAKIMERVNRGNPPWVEAMLAKTPEELRQRLAARKAAVSTSGDYKQS